MNTFFCTPEYAVIQTFYFSVFINSKINLLEAALSDVALFIVYKYDRL